MWGLNDEALKLTRMKNGKLPAYPNAIDVLVHGKEGLTKREYFSAMAMQGLVANNFSPNGFQNGSEIELMKVAVSCADALLAELEKA